MSGCRCLLLIHSFTHSLFNQPSRMNLPEAADLIYTELLNWGRVAVRYVPRLIVSALIFSLFVLLARTLSRLMVRGLTRVSNNQSLVNLTGSLGRVLVLAVGVFVALGVLGLDKTLTSLLAGAGVLALAVGFAFQDLTTNFISGTMIALARPIEVGDFIETNGFQGQVLAVKLRSIVLDNGQGQTVEIPSKDVFQKPIVNYSRIGGRRIELTAGVSYLDDLDRAQTLARSAVARLPFVLKDRPVELHFRNFGDNTIQFVLWFWINPVHTNPQAALSEAIKAIKRTFDDNGVLMLFAPFTFDLKQKLSEIRASA